MQHSRALIALAAGRLRDVTAAGHVQTALVLASAGLVAAPSFAQACAPGPPAGRFTAATQAVYGHVGSVTPDAQRPGRYSATIRVARIYKGQRNTVVRVTAGADGETAAGGLNSCGYGRLERGQRLALLLFGTQRPFDIKATSLISLADLTRISGGKFKRPNRHL